MRDTTNTNRRADLKAALKKAKPDDVLELEALAIIWGTTKPRFVTVRNTMADFPQPMPGQGNKYIYPARKALQCMLDHETRHDDAARAREARTNAILGKTGKRRSADESGRHSVSDLATLSRMASEIEERERDQGLYVEVAANAKVAGDVFGVISEFHSELANKLDPHGLLPAELRARIDTMGSEFLLKLHSRMKDVLSPDAKPRRTGKAAGRPRAARTR